MVRLLTLAMAVLWAGCGDDRCAVERRMNCTGLEASQIDQRYESCQSCDNEVSPVFKEMGDCFDPCVADALSYQCPADDVFWDDACALECTGETSVISAALRLAEMQTHRATLSACR